MTSPHSTAGLAPVVTAFKAAPGRRAPISPLRRAARGVLVVGTVLAVAAAFGPSWAVRIGVGVAVIAAVLACALAWREIAQARRGHAQAMLASSREHGKALSAERTHNASVLNILSQRSQEARAEITRQQTVIAGMRVEISSLRGDKVFLQGEITQRESVIASLRETVRAREAELSSLRAADDEGDDAEVHALPRRVLAEPQSSWEALSDTDDLWSDGSHPTVVDLKMIDTAMVLPNYEEDRRRA